MGMRTLYRTTARITSLWIDYSELGQILKNTPFRHFLVVFLILHNDFPGTFFPHLKQTATLQCEHTSFCLVQAHNWSLQVIKVSVHVACKPTTCYVDGSVT